MKRLLLIALAIVGYCHVANAQITYKPFIPNQSKPSQSQPEPQTVRTTAYYIDTYNRNIYKTPIKVQQQRNAWGTMGYFVVEYYIDSGIGGGWQKVNPAEMRTCNSAFASNELEKRFMYKAFFNNQTHYFDL